ncbi:MAG: hypothetical protein WBJ44_12650 [Propionicimonas sp.]
MQRLSLASTGHLYKREGTTDRQQASSSTEERSLRVLKDQLVVNPMWLTGGSIAVSGVQGAVSPDYRVFESDSTLLVPRYLHHLLRSRPYRDQYDLFVRANTTFDRRIQQDDLDQLPLFLPDLDQQRRIADFLDDRVARIDQIITARNEQRRQLGELRTARLQALQDSWVLRHGEIRLAHALKGMEQGWSPQADAGEASHDEWGVMRAGCVNGGVFRACDNKRLPDSMDPDARYEIRAGDLLMSRASGSLDLIESVAVVPTDVRPRLMLCDKIYRLFPVPGWSAAFLAPMLRTHRNREVIRLGISGAEGMANNLPSGLLKGLLIPMVPPDLQAACADAAGSIEAEARTSETNLAYSVERLQEYKQALITAAVMGELDVTTAGSGIPG